MNWNGIVSLFIACIELLLLINLISFAGKNRFNVLAIILVALLFTYQTLEVLMCMMGYDDAFVVYLAFVVISFLPPLSLMLVAELLKYKSKLQYLLLLPPVFFAIYYKFVIAEFTLTKCTILYAAYHYPLGDLFGAFYYLPILVSIILLIRTVKKSPDKKIKIISSVLLFAYIFACIPVVTAFILMAYKNYTLLSMIESVMCKFAFVYALCLSFAAIYNSKKKDERNNT